MAKKLRTTLSWLLCIVLLFGTVLAEEHNTAGQIFHLDSWPTTGKELLKKNVPTSRREVQRLLDTDKFKLNPNCGLKGSDKYGCFELLGWNEEVYQVKYIPPYTAILQASIPAPPYFDAYHEFVPLKVVRSGDKIFQEWKSLAESGETFNCSGATCNVIVEATGDNKPSNELWYASCNVKKIGNTIGAPEYCNQIAVENEKGVWIEAITGASESPQAMLGRPDFSLKIHGTPPDGTSISKRVSEALKSSPLELETSIYGDHTVFGIASYRVSKVLPGWREIVTVRVDLGSSGWSESKYTGVVISTTLYVNRQNTTSPNDWNLPTEQQNNAYLNIIKSGMLNSLKDIRSIELEGFGIIKND